MPALIRLFTVLYRVTRSASFRSRIMRYYRAYISRRRRFNAPIFPSPVKPGALVPVGQKLPSTLVLDPTTFGKNAVNSGSLLGSVTGWLAKAKAVIGGVWNRTPNLVKQLAALGLGTVVAETAINSLLNGNADDKDPSLLNDEIDSAALRTSKASPTPHQLQSSKLENVRKVMQLLRINDATLYQYVESDSWQNTTELKRIDVRTRILSINYLLGQIECLINTAEDWQRAPLLSMTIQNSLEGRSGSVPSSAFVNALTIPNDATSKLVTASSSFLSVLAQQLYDTRQDIVKQLIDHIQVFIGKELDLTYYPANKDVHFYGSLASVYTNDESADDLDISETATWVDKLQNLFDKTNDLEVISDTLFKMIGPDERTEELLFHDLEGIINDNRLLT